MINFLFCTVLPPEASKVDQTHKFYDFFDLTQFFQIRQKSVLIKINYVKIDVINNFELRDELSRIHSFHSKSSYQQDFNSNHFPQNRKYNFWDFFFCFVAEVLIW